MGNGDKKNKSSYESITIPDGLTYVGHEFENSKKNAGDAFDNNTKIIWRGKTYNDFFDFFYDVGC